MAGRITPEMQFFVAQSMSTVFGELGQFRSPRHIIRVIVAVLDPKIGETAYDPAAGTAGFIAAILG